MLVLALAIHLAAAAPPRPRPTAADSAALVKRVKDAEFRYLMDWRYLWASDHIDERALYHPNLLLPRVISTAQLLRPVGSCYSSQVVRYDVDQHDLLAHLAKVAGEGRHDPCPLWLDQRYPEPIESLRNMDAPFVEAREDSLKTAQLAVMSGFLKESRDTAAQYRRPVLTLLDSAARVLPGDPFIAGQRVRLHVDQSELTQAIQAAKECRAAAWWCAALTGYVQYMMHDMAKAEVSFDQARATMSDSLRCAWDDIEMLLPYSEATTYRRMTCREQVDVNARAWWLADPLFLEKGNPRRAEHYGRRMIIELRRAVGVDEHVDWRDNYDGPGYELMVMRWGWPTLFVTAARCPDPHHRPGGPPIISCPAKPSRFDTKSVALGDTLARPYYWGPQFHLMPNWAAIADPYHVTDAAWDLGPTRDEQNFWDQSWWATEFYRRDGGPLVPLQYQVAFFRRQNAAVMAAAMSWDSATYSYAPPGRVVAGALVAATPTAPLIGVRDTMLARAPHAIAAAVPPGPGLLGLEMVPRDGGPAGRSRTGVVAPPALKDLRRGDLALSDPVLVRATDSEGPPSSVESMLIRMLGTTNLVNPKRVGVFWELYGLAAGDTIDVALRLIRKDDATGAQRLAGALGLRRGSDDSVVVRWREPRPGDAVAPPEGGVTVAPRGVSLDISPLGAGHYTLEVTVQRRAEPPVTTRRELTITR